MTSGSIYKIEFPNGKHYIGLTTTSLEQRTKEHQQCAKSSDNKCLYNALRKYDMVNTLQLVSIDTSDTIEELCDKEILYIIEYNSYYMNGCGYNMTLGGEGTNGYVFTDEDRQKMSESAKKYFANMDEATIQLRKEATINRFKDNPELRDKFSKAQLKRFEDNPNAGKIHSEKMKKYFEDNPETGKIHGERMKKYYEEHPEEREKMSIMKKKYFEEHPEAIEINRASQKKHHEEHPEEREKMSIMKKKYFEDHPEEREKMSIMKKKYFEEHPEEREKMSERGKKRFEDPEAREEHRKLLEIYFEVHPEARKKQSESLKKYYKNPEARQKISERGKKYYQDNPEAVEKMSERGKKRFEDIEARRKLSDGKGKNKPFDIFTTDGTFIKTFNYQIEAREYLQKEYDITSNMNISQVLAGKRNSSNGFIFKYK
jgi:hypothetical protein